MTEHDLKVSATLLTVDEFGPTIKITIQSSKILVAIANFNMLARYPFMQIVYKNSKIEKACRGLVVQNSTVEEFCIFAIAALLKEAYEAAE